MAYQTSVPVTWTSVVLSATEVWQCREGKILVVIGTPPDINAGLELHRLDGLSIAAGKTVNYRTMGGNSAKLATLAREEVQ